ncbi:S-layer homology domain-containing protein [Paenibacillus glycanilyticus]|uniref:SLH domain-containing protein n=1 Tax=Paenibacillus glycanilyticus TaxID=126569 RepID=A0ABQ6G5T3_9BACL|nr:DUF4430 domain-containing protein [Paenibacillus glycanilyticus]GLX66343.1 hypothetical protein MU1_06870 [Paenibacillus glycanilyticus]
MLKRKIEKKYIAACLAIMMLMTLFSPSAVWAAEATSKVESTNGYVTITVEKFTLGQGYILDPVRVPYHEGDRVSDVVTEVLGEGSYRSVGSVDNRFYLSGVYDPDAGQVEIPAYIQQAIGGAGKIGSRANADWLSEFDYTQESGWMYAVNNSFPNVGSSDAYVMDGDVIRWQYTVYGLGRDLGSNEDGGNALIQTANKDALTEKVAEINSSPNKSDILADTVVQAAYDHAYDALTDLGSDQSVVNTALADLSKAMDDNKELDKSELEAAIQQAELTKDSVKASTDGSDVRTTEYWVDDTVLHALTEVIVSAQQLIADSTASQEAVDAKVLALNQAITILNEAKQKGLLEESAKFNVSFKVAPKTATLELYNAKDQRVDIGAAEAGTYNIYNTALPAGDYSYRGFDANGNGVGGGKVTVTTQQDQIFELRQLNLKASNSGWIVNQDYMVKVGQDSPNDTSLTVGAITATGQAPVLVATGHTYYYSFSPSEARTAEGYIELANSVTVTLSSSAQTISASVPLSREISFTVPEGASLFVGSKTKHFIAFTEIEPVATTVVDGKQKFNYKLVNNQEYNYRVSQEGKLTNTGTFKATEANASMEITQEQLNVLPPNAILNRNTYLEGNIYLNINEQNHLKLAAPGEEFKLMPLRSWQALIEGINNYFFEPDYHYEIITGDNVIDIVEGQPGGYSTIRAKANGTAIVKVTYDALKVNGSTYIKEANNAFSAIWPENVGLFVVTVGQGETGITTGIESNKERNQKANEGKTGNSVNNLQNGAFDSDIDSVYYLDTQPGAVFTFTPTAGSEVSVLRPEIDHALGTASYGDGNFSTRNVMRNSDGSFSVLLTEGRNIVKVEKDGLAEYQVMTARPLTVTIDNVTRPGEKVGPGDQVKVSFNQLSFPANKLSGIYNFNGQIIFSAGPEQALVTSGASQYSLAKSLNVFQVPADLEGSYSLKDGRIKLGFFGSPIGAHREIDPLTGANPNFTATAKEGYYSIFPEIVIVQGTEPKAADKTTLLFAVDDAKELLASVQASTDGNDIPQSEYWVTEEVFSQYSALIEEAQALVADESASQEAVNAKVLALEQSYSLFSSAKQQGRWLPIKELLDKQLAYLAENVSNPTFGTSGGEWSVLSLARAGYDVPENYFAKYYYNMVREVKGLMPETSSKPEGLLDRNKGTEHSRLILALTAIGQDIRDVAGYDMSAALADFNYVIKQGINGPIFALIAFDSHQYDIPTVETTANQTTRDKLIAYILGKEVAGGGWSLSGTADPDMTAMAIQALAPYYENKEEVKAAVDRALNWLSAAQNGSGGYSSAGNENVQSVAQVIVALTSLGIDPHTDKRFMKNGNSAIDNLLSFAAPTGGFVHPKGGHVDGMATDQGTYALVAYNRFLQGKTSLYDMTDVDIKDAKPNITVPLPAEEPSLVIPNDGSNYTIRVNESDQAKDVSIDLPVPATSQTFIELPSNAALPQLSITRGHVSLSFPQGIVMDGSGSSKQLELISPNNKEDVAFKTSLMGLIDVNQQIDAITEYFTVGGEESINFTNGFVAITFAGMKGNHVVYIRNGQPIAIHKFASNEAGLASGASEYAYEDGNDLIVKTNHFTDFAVYSVKNKDDGGVVGPEPGKSTALLSIDKLTINKGYVLSPTTVEFTPGETAWDVFKRELDKRGILYEYSYSNKYNSVYVESIAGDGEFDHGDNSGWMYNVNGVYPNYGASNYKLKQGDVVQWRYTTDLGADLGQVVPGGGEEPGTEETENGAKTLADYYKDSGDVSSWAKDLVLQATKKGFIEGFNGRLDPKKEVTRAEFAKLLVEVFNLQTDKISPFHDVESSKWFYPYVNAAYAAGIITGYNDQFKPQDTITREEMAVMIARALKGGSNVANSFYKDHDQIAPWAQVEVDSLLASSIMEGYNGQFNPKGTATREMAFVVIMRAYLHMEG